MCETTKRGKRTWIRKAFQISGVPFILYVWSSSLVANIYDKKRLLEDNILSKLQLSPSHHPKPANWFLVGPLYSANKALIWIWEVFSATVTVQFTNFLIQTEQSSSPELNIGNHSKLHRFLFAFFFSTCICSPSTGLYDTALLSLGSAGLHWAEMSLCTAEHL